MYAKSHFFEEGHWLSDQVSPRPMMPLAGWKQAQTSQECPWLQHFRQLKHKPASFCWYRMSNRTRGFQKQQRHAGDGTVPLYRFLNKFLATIC